MTLDNEQTIQRAYKIAEDKDGVSSARPANKASAVDAIDSARRCPFWWITEIR